MKYSLSVRQQKTKLQNAEEIRVEYKDVNIMYDLIEEMPDKLFNIVIPNIEGKVDFTELKAFSQKVQLIVGVEQLSMIQDCVNAKLDCYWVYPVTTYYELRGLVDMGIKWVKLGAPLYFDLKGVKDAVPDIKIRLVANVCYDASIPHKVGFFGTYIRPEDVESYEDYVDVIEFDTTDLTKEYTLFEIYHDYHKWNGNLNLLLENYGFDVDNRAFPDEFGQARVQCRQNCMRNGACRFCETSAKFSRALDGAKKDWVKGEGFVENKG